MNDFAKDMQEDVEAMNKVFDEGVVSVDATDPPSTDPPGTDPPGTDAPATDAPSTDAPSTDAPATDAPTTEAPEEDPEVKALRQKLAEAEEKLAKKDEDKPTAPPPTEAPLEFEDQDFVGEIDLEELTTKPELFNKFANKLYQKAVLETRKVLGEGVLRSIPEIVKANVTTLAAMKSSSDAFYKENPDLKPFNKVVAAVFEEVIAKDPGKKYGEYMDDVAKETRTRLELHKKATEKKEGKGDKHPKKLPRKKGSSGKPGPKPKTDDLVSDIDKMNESLEEVN